jgi:hypothetical protein
MPLYNMTYEKIEELKEKIKNKETEITTLTTMSEKDIWIKELDELREAYIKEYSPTSTNVTKTVTKTVTKSVSKPVTKVVTKKTTAVKTVKK